MPPVVASVRLVAGFDLAGRYLGRHLEQELGASDAGYGARRTPPGPPAGTVAGDQHPAGDPGPGRAHFQLLFLLPVQLDGQDPTCWNQPSQFSM